MSEKLYIEAISLISPERRESIERIKDADNRKRKLLSELLPRIILSDLTGEDLMTVKIYRTSLGKPYSNQDGFYFNVSHSGDLVVVAVDDSPVGIDIEKIRPVDHRVLDFICTDQERQRFSDRQNSKITDREMLVEFFKLWTKKEAYIKFLGKTVSSLRHLDILEEGYSLRQTEWDDYLISVWSSR